MVEFLKPLGGKSLSAAFGAVVLLLSSASAGSAEGARCVADPVAVIARAPTAAMATTPLPADLAADLDAAVKSVLPKVAAPGIIAGVRTPAGYWTSAYGLADPETGRPMEVGMFTRIGSVTKTFTGTLLMQLVESGAVSLDDTIGQYVDDIPNGDRITLRQLANMTSGVQSYTNLDSFQDQLFAQPGRVFSTDELLGLAIPRSPAFEPGERFDYSNSNFVLLGLVIEKVSGKSLAENYHTGIFAPLGIENTFSPGANPDLPDPHPQGYTLQGIVDHPKVATNATNWNPSWSWATGHLVSTVDDLLTFGRALGTGQGLLGTDAQMTRLNAFPKPLGYGIALGCVDGWIGHDGSEPGYTTTLFYDTTSDTTVAVQANSDIFSGDCEDQAVLPDNSTEFTCNSPALRVFSALSDALGHEYAGHD
ncbi:serine hydrolase domain-containing protein [Mameliella alba]|uniref:serine hydrolase domain-containing protein n=1 Tax=Mameliella alba TaxID=561184 RepID=UPI001FD7BACE|nr:serine hydrolase domain-containing protein [Mameliella alba]